MEHRSHLLQDDIVPGDSSTWMILDDFDFDLIADFEVYFTV